MSAGSPSCAGGVLRAGLGEPGVIPCRAARRASAAFCARLRAFGGSSMGSVLSAFFDTQKKKVSDEYCPPTFFLLSLADLYLVIAVEVHLELPALGKRPCKSNRVYVRLKAAGKPWALVVCEAFG